ncbi:MAG: hypothetical protein EXR72_01240 [Myxococcales bacterium]|nr:hypothetical protein [Myxococcales bacterium]
MMLSLPSLALPLALCASLLIGCLGRKDAGGAGGGEDTALKALQGLRVVRPVDARDAGGRTTFSIGDLSGTLPAGWSALTMGGQTTYRSADFQETMRVFGYRSETPLDAERQRAVLGSLTDLGGRAERVLGMLGMSPKVSPPQVGRAAWGASSTFTAMGPLNRIAFHYATVGPREAIMIQLDGNTETQAPAHALAVIQSLRHQADPAADAVPATK